MSLTHEAPAVPVWQLIPIVDSIEVFVYRYCQTTSASRTTTGSSNIPSSCPALKPSALSGNMLAGQQGFKSSNKSSNTSSSALPSDTNPSTGKRVLNNWLWSITMSREAFSLFHGFNPNNSSFFSIKEAIVAKKNDCYRAEVHGGSHSTRERPGEGRL